MKKAGRGKVQKTEIVKDRRAMAESKSQLRISGLYKRVREILDAARQRAARSINTEMVQAYWLIGQAIVEQEQKGKRRAGYGEQLIESLSQRMRDEGIKGFSRNNLWYIRQFYLAYPEKLHALCGELSWTHYRLLMRVENLDARAFYEIEAAEGDWSTRAKHLEHQFRLSK
ncbi:MAG: DUF1016 N-terminal domain-containing protein [Blastocatellia bacterium]|nr:DUF1016 N-terminal domain-containing protein [Blastocatellia bacterium]